MTETSMTEGLRHRRAGCAGRPRCARLALVENGRARGPRVVVIGLDGLEVTHAERLMAAGELPALADLGRRSARFLLDHGPAQRTGLAWGHVASGLPPGAGG